MADTTRSLASLQTLLADNTAGDISAQDARDFLVSAYKPQSWIPGGRLTLTTGTPVTTSDVTSAGTLYYTPYIHNCIGLYDGTSWTLFTFTERSLSLTLTSGKNYDVFLYDNSGTLTLELSAAWTNDTTRADALTTQDGVYVKSGATTRRWLGTIRASGSNVTEDSGGGSTTQVGGKRFVWNAYNQVPRWMSVFDSTNSWTYGTHTIRQANAASGNKVEWVTGSAGTLVLADLVASIYALSNTTNDSSCGVGIDSTTAYSGLRGVGYVSGLTGVTGGIPASYRGYPGLGYHYAAWLEAASAGGTTQFVGDDGDFGQCGLNVWLMG